MYWGANVGYSWGQSKNDRTLFGLGATARESQDLDGVIGGVQTGYNYQFGAWVWGLETDIQASGQKGSAVPRGRASASWRRPISCCTERPVWPTAKSRTPLPPRSLVHPALSPP